MSQLWPQLKQILFYSGLNEPQWTFEKGYLIDPASYPRGLSNPTVVSIPIVIPKADVENFCGLSRFSAIFHLPNEYPNGYQKTIYFKSDETLSVQINAKSLRTDMDLKDFPIEFRKCYFMDEKKLKFFKDYTQSNCKMECYVNVTIADAGCVLFYMPRDSKTPICKASQLKFAKGVTMDELTKCDCYPLCNDIKYSYEVEKLEFSTKSIPEHFRKS